MVEIRQSSYMWQNVKLNRIQAVLLVALVRDGRLPDVDCLSSMMTDWWSLPVSDVNTLTTSSRRWRRIARRHPKDSTSTGTTSTRIRKHTTTSRNGCAWCALGERNETSANHHRQGQIMKHNEQETMCSLEWLEHERRKAWQEGYAAGWKDQECDFPQYTSENPYKE